jgi:5-formyltetrahydrofolate cyclo-ligase
MSEQISIKKQLRATMKNLLAALTNQEKDHEAGQMIEKITAFIQASPEIKTVSSYAAMPLEINLDTLHSSLPEVSFCYPKCAEAGQMEFYAVGDLSEMKASDYGMREPDESLHERIDPEAIDLFLCPAYAYTHDGKRLGKGGGYYDRYLLRKRPDATTLGVIFSSQMVAHVPSEAHDLIVDQVL